MKFWVTDGVFHKENTKNWQGQLVYEDKGECIEIPDGVERVEIPEGVTVIGNTAFYNPERTRRSNANDSEAGIWDNLKSVVLPAGLKEIQTSAFYGCFNLEEIELPEGLTYLGYSALSGTAIRSVRIPESVQKIDYYCFNECAKLEELILPQTPTEVENEIFRGCSSLKRVSVPPYIKEAFVCNGCTSLETIAIPKDAEKLPGNAFKDCTSLSEVVLPDVLRDSISDQFAGCTALQRISIPGGVFSIDGFASCKNLREVTLAEGIKYIDSEAFMDCVELREIALPSTVKRVFVRAFAGCSQLSKVVVKGSLKEFASTAFQKCPALKEVYISEDQAKDARKIFGVKAKLFALDGTPIELEKPKAPVQSTAKNAQDQDVLDRIAKSIKLTKLLQWAEKKGLTPGAVKFADSSKKPPKEAALFILYAYMHQLPKLPAYHADSYKKDIVALEIVPEADAIAGLLDRESLCKALVKTTPSLVIQYYADKDFEKVIKLTPNKPLSGSEKAEQEKLDVYYTWKVSFVNADFLLPYCRYAGEEQIKVLIATAGKLMRDWGRTGRQASIVYRSALLLSDTPAAMEFAEKNGNLALYAKMRGTTPDALRKAAATKTGLNASGNLKFDLYDDASVQQAPPRIEARLTNELKLVLFDVNAGREVRSFPKKGIDPAKREAAEAKYKEAKKNIQEAVKQQLSLLLIRYNDGSYEAKDEWTSLYLSDPLLMRIAQLLVWEQEAGKSAAYFTVWQGQTVCENGEPYMLGSGRVRLAHPVEMNERRVSSWQRYFLDRGLKQPFAQVLWEPVIPWRQRNFSEYYKGAVLTKAQRSKLKVALKRRGIDVRSDEMAREYDYYRNQYVFSGNSTMHLGRCLDIEYSVDADSGDTTLGRATIHPRASRREINSVLLELDQATIVSQIEHDNAAVLTDAVLGAFTVAQIASLLDVSIGHKAASCTAKLLDYKNARFPEYSEINEFTLDW